MQVRENLIRWIDEWQKGDAKKYGAVEITPDISLADVILARYVLRENVSTGTYPVPGAATVYDPATNSFITRPVINTRSYSTIPLYYYVLGRENDGIKILSRRVDRTYARDDQKSGESLKDRFFKMMKARAKTK